MQESDTETQRREETIRLYHALKDALKILSEVSTKTVSTPVPPPVKDDWMPAPDPPVQHHQTLAYVAITDKCIHAIMC